MQPVRYESRNERRITNCVDYMRSVFPIPTAGHEIVTFEDGTRKASVQTVEELSNPSLMTVNHTAFAEGFTFMSEVLKIQDYDYDPEVIQYAGRISALHACRAVGISPERLGLNG